MAELKTYSSTSSAERTKAVPCPICASSHTARVWTTQGVLFVRCAVCGLWRQNPQPVQEDLLLRYGDEYLAYEMDRQLDYRRISLQSLAQAGLHADRAGGSLLEVGCATGALLAAFRDGGWDVVGVEAGAAMAEYARKHWNIDVRHGTLESSHMQAESVDAFVATHLIEHLNDPRSFLREARR
ncbi:MAG TPA: class I SAM-dependent methyltransferase, partial [Spirochaetales bacterium]|nr:class I SAM-dependent methyltransferase [Spirochaetales bacterium]